MKHLLFLQLASLKDTIARKDEEIEKLLLVKDIHHPPQRLQKPMMRRKSIGHTDDINSDTGEYSSQQSRYSVTDGESLASSAEAEDDERLSEITSDAASNGTQGSMDVAKRPPKISDRLQQHILLSLLLLVLRDLFSSSNVLNIGFNCRAKSMTARSSTSVTRPLDKLRKVATRTTSTVAKVTAGLSSSSKGLSSSSKQTENLLYD